MAGVFFDAFNPVLPDMEAQFTEEWLLDGTSWPAIAIETLDVGDHVIKGGILHTTEVRIHVREEIFEQSQVEVGHVVTVRGEDLSVNRIQSDGDAAKVLVCGPKGVDIWK